MSFLDWIYSRNGENNPPISGQWELPHILTLLGCIALIITLTLIFRKRSEKARKTVIWTLVFLIFAFEISRRVINFCKEGPLSFTRAMYILLPRPWCAIACWSLIISVFINKKFFYNFSAMTALLTSIVFFSWPSVGFNRKIILFENLYSISTHSLLLITSICLITLKFTKFEYKTIWKEAILLVGVFIYSFLEIWALKIETDPLYYMNGNDIMKILGVSYPAYLVLYILVLFVYFNMFYLIDDRKNIFKKNKA